MLLVDLYALYNAIYQLGGDEHVTKTGQWEYVYNQLKLPNTLPDTPPDIDYLIELYRSYFFEWQGEQQINFDQLKTLTEHKPALITKTKTVNTPNIQSFSIDSSEAVVAEPSVAAVATLPALDPTLVPSTATSPVKAPPAAADTAEAVDEPAAKKQRASEKENDVVSADVATEQLH